ncbi:MAG: amidohydrolase family protein [Kiritimatiellae bacterium]|nr:amidohydrolase family protein [Kiritimatiellia bacterium]
MGAWIKFPIPGHDAAAMVRQMDRAGVERMVCAHQGCLTGDVRYGNDEVLRAMAKFPGRILGWAACFPVNRELGIDEVKRCIGQGMVGIKMHSANKIPYAAASYADIWEYAERKRLPVLLHTWGDLGTLDPVLKRVKKAPILLAHAGCTAPEAYVQCARKHKNVYLELAYSGSSCGLVEYFVEHAGADRVVFGSDMPWMALGEQIGRVVFADIREREKKQILADNAARILRR